VPGWRSALALPRADQWTGFALIAAVAVLAAAAFEFVSSGSTLGAGARAAESLGHAAILVLWALAGGVLVWVGIRVFTGRAAAPEVKETVLWSACLLVILASALRFFN
jgi:hypothetical protein